MAGDLLGRHRCVRYSVLSKDKAGARIWFFGAGEALAPGDIPVRFLYRAGLTLAAVGFSFAVWLGHWRPLTLRHPSDDSLVLTSVVLANSSSESSTTITTNASNSSNSTTITTNA